MNKPTSIYLDLVRFLAAMTVFFVHAGIGRYSGGLPILWRFTVLESDAVMVFFVLSGLVIAYVADQKEKTLKDYSISRLARLYSVVAPALLATVILDLLGSHIDPSLYIGWYFRADNPLWRFFANFVFINELWFSSVKPFTNNPFWSLGYEFWYYVLFAAAHYLDRSARYLVIAAVSLFVGPKILILFPVWLLGVWVYFRISRKPVTELAGWALVLGSIGGYLIFRLTGTPQLLLDWTDACFGGAFENCRHLGFSQYFLSSYVIGALVAIHFVGISAIAQRLAGAIERFEVPIRYLASFTFSAYLFHFPLLQFFAAASSTVENVTLRSTITVFGTLAAIWALGMVSERRKSDYRRWLLAAWNAIQRRES